MADLLKEYDAFDFEDESVLLPWESLVGKDNFADLNDVTDEENDLYGSSLVPKRSR